MTTCIQKHEPQCPVVEASTCSWACSECSSHELLGSEEKEEGGEEEEEEEEEGESEVLTTRHSN